MSDNTLKKKYYYKISDCVIGQIQVTPVTKSHTRNAVFIDLRPRVGTWASPDY